MEIVQENLLTESQVLNIPEAIQNITEESNLSLNTCNSQQQEEVRYRQFALRWIFSYPRNIAINTRYLATAYLLKLNNSIKINKCNYEKLAVTVLLIACKLNQIHPPKVEKMIAGCKTKMEKGQIVQTEAQILHIFNFDVAFEETTYSKLYKVLGTTYQNILQKAQKLLRIVTIHNQIHVYGQQIAIDSVIFAMLPNLIKQMNRSHFEVVTELARKMHRHYTQQCSTDEKQNCPKIDKNSR